MAVSQEIEFKVDREKLEWLMIGSFDSYYDNGKVSKAIESVFPNALESMQQPLHHFFAEMSDEDLIKVFNAIKI